ncbi:MAG: rod shape-determining protein [Erysipelotrichaceae bacterium]|nr:rod shape-determining protein [Erysipelotrichaceae bacterium]
MRHVYTSIDIGSDAVKVVVCELCKNKLNLLGASSIKSKGIKKGVISDPTSASEAISAATHEVEEMLGFKIKKALVTLPSYFAVYKPFNEKIESDGSPITSELVVKLMQQIVTNNANKKSEIASIQILDFKVDGKETKDPKDLSGRLLEVRGVISYIPKENLFSVVTLLEELGISVVDVCIGPVSDYFTYKSKEYDNKDGIIVNMGAETTTVGVVSKGIVVKSSVIQFGGKSVDNDIAYIYKIDNQVGQNLKEKFAFAHSSAASSSEVTTRKNIVNEEVTISQPEITEIVSARLEEILKLVKKEISSLTNMENDYIIITGGTSNMIGLAKLANEVLGPKAEIEAVKLLGIRNNKYSTALGTIIYFANKLKIRGQEYSMISKEEIDDMISNAKSKNINGNVLDKVFNYFFSE